MIGLDHRLASYGTLAPGQPNHHQLANLDGRWRPGTVMGRLVAEGWGSAIGFPALVLDGEGAEIAVQLFESADLPGHWMRLDAFEGDGYRRVAAEIVTEAGPVQAWIYVSAGPPLGTGDG